MLDVGLRSAVYYKDGQKKQPQNNNNNNNNNSNNKTTKKTKKKTKKNDQTNKELFNSFQKVDSSWVEIFVNLHS